MKKNITRFLSLSLVLLLLFTILPLPARAIDRSEIEALYAQGIAEFFAQLRSPTLNIPATQAHTGDGQFMGRVTLGDLDKVSYLDENGSPTRVNDDWAAPYLAWGTQLGIISGSGGADPFNPDSRLSSSAFGQMLLRALGYNPLFEGVDASDWSQNMAEDAGITRAAAAYKFYNALISGTSYQNAMVQSLQQADPSRGWTEEKLMEAFADADGFENNGTIDSSHDNKGTIDNNGSINDDGTPDNNGSVSSGGSDAPGIPDTLEGSGSAASDGASGSQENSWNTSPMPRTGFMVNPTVNIMGYSVQKSSTVTSYPATTLVDGKLIQAAQAAGADLALHNALGTLTIPNGELKNLTPPGSAGVVITTQPTQTGAEGAAPLGALGGGFNGIDLGIQSVTNPHLFTGSFQDFAGAAQDGLASGDLGSLSAPVKANIRLHLPGSNKASGTGYSTDENGYLHFDSITVGSPYLISGKDFERPGDPAPNGSVSANITLEVGQTTTLTLKNAKAEEFLDAVIGSYPGLDRIVAAHPADQTNSSALFSLLHSIFGNAANGTLWKRWDKESEGSINFNIDFYLPMEYRDYLTQEGMAYLLNALGLMSEEEALALIEAVLATFPDSATGDSKLSIRQTIAILYFAKVVYENFTQNNASLSPLAAQKYLADTMKQYRTEEGDSTGSGLPVGYYFLHEDGTYEFLGSDEMSGYDASHYYDGTTYHPTRGE